MLWKDNPELLMTFTGGWMNGRTDRRTDEAILVGAAWMRRILITAVAPTLTYFVLVTFSPYDTIHCQDVFIQKSFEMKERIK
jgi:hypothetical protein